MTTPFIIPTNTSEEKVPANDVTCEFELRWLAPTRTNPRLQLFSIPSLKYSLQQFSGQYSFYLDADHSTKDFYAEEKGTCIFTKVKIRRKQ
jgi:hypothetical protein